MNLVIPEFLKRAPNKINTDTDFDNDVVSPKYTISSDTSSSLEPAKTIKGQKLVLSTEKQNTLKGWALASDLEDATFALQDIEDVILMIRKTEAKPVVARLALKKFSELIDELNLIGFDEQVTEAYEYLEPKKIQEKAEEISQALNQYINNKRNKGKKAYASVEKKLINVKFKKEDEILQVTSLSPSQITGKQKLVTFDSKSRNLVIYKALDASGLKIKGTTIINFDSELTRAKNIRNPQQLINGLVRATEHRIQKQFDEINSKAKKATGRTNMNTLFVRVFK